MRDVQNGLNNAPLLQSRNWHRPSRFVMAVMTAAFRRYYLLPLLLLAAIVIFYDRYDNIYRHADYAGDLAVLRKAFDLLQPRPAHWSGLCRQKSALVSDSFTVCLDSGLRLALQAYAGYPLAKIA